MGIQIICILLYLVQTKSKKLETWIFGVGTESIKSKKENRITPVIFGPQHQAILTAVI
jgi:hypothetical protein